ncbi:hypothetical protein R50072_02990 [Simiduia litorea]
MRFLVFFVAIFFITSANADYSCEVNVARVLVYGNGSVNVLHSGRNDYTYICNLKGTWKDIDTVTCSMWTSMLQSTQNNNKNAIFYFGGEGTCATLPLYGESPAPVYIGSID